MNESNETIKSWMDIFFNVNNPDQDEKEETNEKIQDKLDNDKGFLVDVCTKILMIEDNDDDKVMKSKTISSILLSKCLEISNKSDLELLRQVFEQNPEMLEQIKEAVKANIFSNNSCIRNKSAQCYSYLIAILDEWKEGIDEIVNSYSNPDLLPNEHIGLLSIMSEIVNQETFAEEVIKNFENQFAQTIVFCINILNADPSEEKIIPKLRYEACRFIHDIMYVYKEIFDTEEKKAGRIPALLENLPNSFIVNDIDLFRMLNQLLFMIVKQYYEQSRDFMETIANYVGNGFEMMSINPECVIISIDFWREVASLEDEIITNKNTNVKLNEKHIQKPLKPLLSVTASEVLIPIFLSFIENIDEDDTSVEDFEQKAEPSMYANLAVSTFYKLKPKPIFKKVKERIEEINGKIENWTQLHAIIIMLYSIAIEPTLQEVSEYISDKFDLILEASLPHQVPRLRETAVFFIAFLTMNYPEIIIRQGETTGDRITDIINSIESALNIKEENQSEIPADTLLIFFRYTIVIHHLANAWKNYIYQSKIDVYFDKLNDILERLFNFGILNNDQTLIKSSSDALNQIIFNLTPEHSDKLNELYKKILDFLDQSRTQYLPQEIRFIVQSSFCLNIHVILLKLKNINRPNCQDIINTYSQRTLHLVYELLNNENTYIYEQGFGLISSLINATSYPQNDFYLDLFDEDTYHRLVDEFIINGLNSLNSHIIEKTCSLIGILYYFLLPKIPDLRQTLYSFFPLLLDIIDNKEIRESHPFVLKAIADMFDSLKPHDYKIAEFEVPLRELIETQLEVSNKLDFTNDSDVDYGNIFYIHLTDALRSYEKIYFNTKKEKEQLLPLDRLATYIYKLSPRISDDLYMAFAKTVRMFGQNCRRRNDVFLKHRSIRRIMEQGYETVTASKVKFYIEEQIHFIKKSDDCAIF